MESVKGERWGRRSLGRGTTVDTRCLAHTDDPCSHTLQRRCQDGPSLLQEEGIPSPQRALPSCHPKLKGDKPAGGHSA